MASKTVSTNFIVPLAGFAAPRYVAADPLDSTGFDISDAKALAVSVISMGTNTVVAEQTFDRSGAAGWFPVLGQRVDDATAAVGSAFTAAKGFVFPVIGARMRFRVTALATADLVASIALLDDVFDISTGQGANALAAGTNLLGSVAQSASATVGTGTTNAKIASGAAVISTVIKASAGKLHSYRFHNNTASAKFAKFYNRTTAAAPATDVPIFTVIIPANGIASYLNPIGKAFATGITLYVSGGIAETDTTALAANDIVGHVDFI